MSLLKLAVGTARYRLTGWRAPLHACWVATRRCDALCGYCAMPLQTGHRPHPAPATLYEQEMSTEEAADMLDQLAARGCSRLDITGGEPLVRADMGALLGRAQAHGMEVRLETDGSRLPAFLEAGHRPAGVVLPLEGGRAIHDRLREPGSFVTVQRALAAARAAGVPARARTVLTALNLDQIGPVLQMAEEGGFQVSFQLYHREGAPSGREGARLTPEAPQIQRALREVLEAKLAGRPVGMQEKTLRYLLTWGDYRKPMQEEVHEDLHCLAGYLYCAIDADGTVYPCSLRVGAKDLERRNIREVGLEAAFDVLRRNTCRACTESALSERNYLYNLNLPALFEYATANLPQQRTPRSQP